MSDTGWLEKPGESGAMGALMDEYARAAEDLCLVVDSLAPARFEAKQKGSETHTESMRAVCQHIVSAARRYSDYIRKARGLPYGERFVLAPDQLKTPTKLRPLLIEALRYTEEGLDGLYEASEQEIAAIRFEVRWGPTYDPDMILEHAIVHLMRHRRQLLRWP